MPILGTAGHPVGSVLPAVHPGLAFAVARFRLFKREHASDWLQRTLEPCMQEFCSASPGAIKKTAKAGQQQG